jgi:regulator of protease activity HflC (stomatin/prohibitin superfamily)
MRNIADTLDYQFGFKVSSTWIYTFVERALFPLLIIWILVLWVFTSITEVGPNQVGVRECFGEIVNRDKLLEPGIYLNAPWPFGKISRFSCEQIHSVMIGPLEDEGHKKEAEPEDDGHGHNKKPEKKHDEKQETVLWTEAHFHGTKGMFLVASKSETGRTNSVSSSLSYLGAMVDVQYQIRKKDLIKFAYINKDSKEMLKLIGRKVLTKYFASEPMIELMSSKREKVGPALTKLIQKNADQEGLGVKIVAVSLLDAHPPIKDVAPAYQKVIGARQKKESMVYKADAYEARVIPAAKVAQQRMLQEAISYRYDKIKVAEAESERFTQQLIGYQKMPHALYKLRTYLSFLEKDCADIRKYIMSANTPYQIYEFNLEEKPRLDLIDTDLGDITN